MHKDELIKEIAKSTKLLAKDIEAFINSFMETVTKALKKGDEVRLIGFGSFKTAKTKARVGRNPKTGKELKIPAKRRPKFVAGAKLKSAVE